MMEFESQADHPSSREKENILILCLTMLGRSSVLPVSAPYLTKVPPTLSDATCLTQHSSQKPDLSSSLTGFRITR